MRFTAIVLTAIGFGMAAATQPVVGTDFGPFGLVAAVYQGPEALHRFIEWRAGNASHSLGFARRLQQIPPACAAACPDFTVDDMTAEAEAMAKRQQTEDQTDPKVMMRMVEDAAVLTFKHACKHRQAYICVAQNQAVCQTSSTATSSTSGLSMSDFECMCDDCPCLVWASARVMGAIMAGFSGGQSMSEQELQDMTTRASCHLLPGMACQEKHSSCANTVNDLKQQTAMADVFGADSTATAVQTCKDKGIEVDIEECPPNASKSSLGPVNAKALGSATLISMFSIMFHV